MRIFFLFLLLFLSPGIQPFVHAISCPVCLENAEPSCLSCNHGHPIHTNCLIHQVRSFVPNSKEQAQEILFHGLPCCSNGCNQKLSLARIQDYIGWGSLESFNKMLQAKTTFDEQPQERDSAQEFRDSIVEAFNRGCPSCGILLPAIEGCNAATCERCGTLFCNLCLEKQGDRAASHAHTRTHSGNFWEHRDGHTGLAPQERTPYLEAEEFQVIEEDSQLGKRKRTVTVPYTYVDRYHWLIAREKLDHLLQKPISKEQIQILNELEPLFRKNKMWPIPMPLETLVWINQVKNVATLDQRNKIALLQNEFVFLSQKRSKILNETERGNLAHWAELIKETLSDLNAPVFTTLDFRRVESRTQSENIIPLFEGREGWEFVPEGIKALGEDHIYRVHDPVGKVPDYILSKVLLNPVDHRVASSYCTRFGVRLPTPAELEALARAMGQGQPEGYDPRLIPDIEGHFFWSRMIHQKFRFQAYYYNGTLGSISYMMRGNAINTVCVSTIL